MTTHPTGHCHWCGVPTPERRVCRQCAEWHGLSVQVGRACDRAMKRIRQVLWSRVRHLTRAEIEREYPHDRR